MAATTSGIVMNGPIPHICVMLTATPERTPRYRTNPWPLAGALAGAAPAPPGLPSFSAIVLPWLEYLEAEPGDSAARPAASAQSRRGPLSDVSLLSRQSVALCR
jgi:hypothetical protein